MLLEFVDTALSGIRFSLTGYIHVATIRRCRYRSKIFLHADAQTTNLPKLYNSTIQDCESTLSNYILTNDKKKIIASSFGGFETSTQKPL